MAKAVFAIAILSKNIAQMRSRERLDFLIKRP